MIVLLLVALPGGAEFGVVPDMDVVVDDATACVDQAELKRELPALPEGSRVTLTVRADERGAPETATLTVTLPDVATAPLSRDMLIRPGACPRLPALAGRIIDRFVADLPAEAWQRRPPIAKNAALTARAPPVVASSVGAPPEAIAVAVRARGDRSRLVGRALIGVGAGIDPSLRGEARASLELSLPLDERIRIGGFLDAGGSLLAPVAYGAGTVGMQNVAAGGGGAAWWSTWFARAGARAGAGLIQGNGFAQNASQTVPSAEAFAALGTTFAPFALQLESAVPILTPRFTAPGLAPRDTSPIYLSFALGVEFDMPLGTDPISAGNVREEASP